MSFKNGDQGIGYYKDGQQRVVSRAEELLPMRSCAPMKLKIEELLVLRPMRRKTKPQHRTGDGERKAGKKVARF